MIFPMAGSPYRSVTNTTKASTIWSRVAFFAQWTMIGQTSRKWYPFKDICSLTQGLRHRVHQGIETGDLSLHVTAFSWPTFLYPEGQYDPTDPSKGLFGGEPLVRVCIFANPPYSLPTLIIPFQAFQCIFTLPSSSDHEWQLKSNLQPLPSTRRPPKLKGCVAELIRMTTIQPRAIAYAAVQVRFTRNGAPHIHYCHHSFILLCQASYNGPLRMNILIMKFSTIKLWITSRTKDRKHRQLLWVVSYYGGTSMYKRLLSTEEIKVHMWFCRTVFGHRNIDVYLPITTALLSVAWLRKWHGDVHSFILA